MMMVEALGWLAGLAGAAVMWVGLYTVIGQLMFYARWKWGDAHQMARSVRLGWNTGEPPEGVRILVRKNAWQVCNGAVYVGDQIRNADMAVMMRHGDRCYSANGAISTPITNITGWLAIVDEQLEQSNG